ALLALLACRAEGLTASRMAEFLSLGEAAPADADAGERAVPTVVPDDDVMPVRQVGANPDDGSLEVAPPESVVAPRRWEQLLIDAAVIGGLDRWKRRLKALDAALLVRQSALDDDASDSLGQHLERQREQLAALSDYVLPLVETLAELPDRATWGEWLTSLGALANRALKSPERVLEVLAELRPMAAVGPVGIDEVRIVLGRRLSELLVSQKGSPAGRVLVASVDEARGREFAVVFVPGLAERLFPRKVVEDPILLDSNRAPMAVGLTVSEHRVAAERLALHLAVGAATESLVLTFPRIDLESARPRVPSFYGLEVLRAAEGRLPGFEELLRRAEAHDEGDVGARRVGWPAPADPKRAIDTAEYDLAWLSQLLEAAGGRVGSARYLMEGNAHLGRALRSRYMVGQRAWTRADGLVKPRAGAHAALKKHALDQRSFSPTALQKFTGCPYRFFLYTVMRLQPREAPEFMEEMNPLERGSLVHDAQYDVLVELEKRGWLPLNQTNRLDARVVLEQVVDRLAAEYRDRLAPAIERVWEDGITLIRSDLQEWLFNLAGDTEWFPWRFELAFGRFRGDRRDPRSEPESIALDCGLSVHGSIDRVDRTRVAVAGAMALRATDTKTGRVSIGKDAVIAGGKALQPVIYALALEKMNPEATVVAGRLDFCTSRGGFEYRDVELDERARASADRLAEVLGGALDERFFPRAPGAGECRWCDFQTVCGSGPEERLPTKAAGQLLPLLSLREMP
ncbi:MAG: ATP-dependent helicase/nuclease subunit B, partial [Myxococcota bacterium]